MNNKTTKRYNLERESYNSYTEILTTRGWKEFAEIDDFFNEIFTKEEVEKEKKLWEEETKKENFRYYLREI